MIRTSEILRGKILIVDDQDSNVRVLDQMLRGAGYQSVASTRDPTAVRELHDRNRYDLILLDLQMPVMDGFQVMDELKQVEAGGYLPVLVLTAQPNHKLRALKAGARDFVSKPFDLPEVLMRVSNMLEVRLLHLEDRKRSEQELVLAQQTQESLLPRALPHFANYQLHAFNSPTRYVGGDFYDFGHVSGEAAAHSGEWIGVLADISGKGMPAALLSSMVVGALSMEFRRGTQPLEILNRVNQLLLDKSLSFQFMTLFLFSLNSDGAGQFLSAGHNPAFVYRRASGMIEELPSNGEILGVFDRVSYEYCPLELDSGDILIVYSDGVTEAMSTAEEMFGSERLVELIGREGRAGGAALKAAFLQSISDFTQGAPQTDDITFLVVEKS